MTALLWDLDGTLVDSVADIAAAADATLRALGRPPLGEAVVRGFVGEGARTLVQRCLAAAGVPFEDAHLALFLAQYRAAPVVRTRAYAGVAELVARVAWPQAVVTNKPEDLARTILGRLGLAFPVVIGGETLPVRKPDPAPLREACRRLGCDDGVMVGDGPADVGAARAAGFPMIGVGWGISRPAGADVHVAGVTALVDVLAARGALR